MLLRHQRSSVSCRMYMRVHVDVHHSADPVADCFFISIIMLAVSLTGFRCTRRFLAQDTCRRPHSTQLASSSASQCLPSLRSYESTALAHQRSCNHLLMSSRSDGQIACGQSPCCASDTPLILIPIRHVIDTPVVLALIFSSTRDAFVGFARSWTKTASMRPPRQSSHNKRVCHLKRSSLSLSADMLT